MNSENINKEGLSVNNKNKSLITIIIILLVIILVLLALLFTNFLNDKNRYEKINYEIKEISDSNTDAEFSYLYVNDKKVDDIKAFVGMGSLEIQQFKDVLIVDETNPGPTMRLFIVDENGNATELDYKVSTYDAEFINYIDSYRIDGNDLHVKVVRQWGNAYIDWYCRYDDKSEIAEYEVVYEYKDSKFIRKEVINEVSINDKYKDEDCSNVE